MLSQQSTGRGGNNNNSRQNNSRPPQQRPILNINATPAYSDYLATQEHQKFTGWQPSYLPEFGDAAGAAETAYADYYSPAYASQDELTVEPHGHLGLTYGMGSPHREPVHEASTSNQVKFSLNEWWIPAVFPRAMHLLKVDTGAHVNVMSVADMSRVGYDFRDLRPSSVLLVGFNKSIVQPRGQLHT
jgi:hypothetical protein